MKTVVAVFRAVVFAGLLAAVSAACSAGEPGETVPLYGKVERFASNNALGISGDENPCDPRDIKVDVRIRFPDGTIRLHPCFWYVPSAPFYEVMFPGSGPNASEWERFRQTGPGRWCFRFSPRVAGEYSYRYIVSRGGAVRSRPGGTFRCSATRASRPLPLGPDKDTRYFARADGSFFLPIGHNLAWPPEDGSRTYTQWLEELSRAGANCARLWLIHYSGGTSAEWSSKKVNAGYNGAGYYSQESGARTDAILKAAGRHAVYLVFSFFSFGDLGNHWPENPYSVYAGGYLEQPSEFFVSARARADVKARLRYAVARYGWSPCVFAWELWNEVDIAKGYSPEISKKWHREMSSYVSSIDVHDHLVTTSTRIPPPFSSSKAHSLEEIDFVNVHCYSPRPTAALPVYIQGALESGKPALVSEYGLSGRPDYFEADPAGLHLHDGIWCAVFSGAAGTAMSWWWDSYIHPRGLCFHYTGVSRFFENEDLRGFSVTPCRLDSGYGEYFAFALQNGKKLLAWTGPRRDVYADMDGKIVSYKREGVCRPARLRIPGDFEGRWTATAYDTFDGTAVARSRARIANGDLLVDLPAFRHDIAVKCEPAAAGDPSHPSGETPLHNRFEKMSRRK
ncbi:MAG: hypothetical protein R6V03_09490 [Kiritimatiellia bacterium]